MLTKWGPMHVEEEEFVQLKIFETKIGILVVEHWWCFKHTVSEDYKMGVIVLDKNDDGFEIFEITSHS